MKKLTAFILIIGFKASAICTFDVYLREHKIFDGKQTKMTFATGEELNELGSDFYEPGKLYAYEVINGEATWYEITTTSDCGLVSYDNCIKKMPSMLDAKNLSGKEFKIIVYK
tara:strand:- start:1473 stop:1811 length:339 start_codon:yes stop_codon:yes gene_type:complete